MSVVSLYNNLPAEFKPQFGVVMSLVPKLGHFRPEELQQWLVCLRVIQSIVAGDVLPCGDTTCANAGKSCRVCIDDVVADISHKVGRYAKRPSIRDSAGSTIARMKTRQILTKVFAMIDGVVNDVPDNMACEGVVYLLTDALNAEMAVSRIDGLRVLHTVVNKHYDQWPIAYFIWHIEEFMRKYGNNITVRLNYIIGQSLASLCRIM